MNSKTRWITETAIMLAMLVILQAVTKSAGQLVTGSCVNAVLAVSVLVSGCASGLTVALVSPFVAFLLGIGPQLLPIVPAIALGNAVYVLMLGRIVGKKSGHVAADSGAAGLCRRKISDAVSGGCEAAVQRSAPETAPDYPLHMAPIVYRPDRRRNRPVDCTGDPQSIKTLINTEKEHIQWKTKT